MTPLDLDTTQQLAGCKHATNSEQTQKSAIVLENNKIEVKLGSKICLDTDLKNINLMGYIYAQGAQYTYHFYASW